MTPFFAIEFCGEPWTDEDGRWQSVRLMLHTEKDGDVADLLHWSTADYEKQWRFELKALLTERTTGALITCIHDPLHVSRTWVWSMWRVESQVYFQNRILFMLQTNGSFAPERVSEFVGPFKPADEDGTLISTWLVPLDEIQSFLDQKEA